MGQTEKPTGYYLHNHLFQLKMAALVALLLLEIRPVVTLIRWRAAVGRGREPDTAAGAVLARTSYIQAVLVLVMLAAATAMARGWG